MNELTGTPVRKRGDRVMQTRTSAGGRAWARLRSWRWRAEFLIACSRSVSFLGGLRRGGTDSHWTPLLLVRLVMDFAATLSSVLDLLIIVKN
jgi:hypothetical protein